jgi:tRNA-splicing ligase RtcB (3'-phosphate/5'-hydroxy nucleic acid ligase)
MSYEKLDLNADKPVLSWANHPLGAREERMAQNVASLPFVFKHVALMPDVHLGKGALVGSVVATKDALIPAAVGVDIGCFTYDTQIPLLDGKSYAIGELADDRSEFWIYSCTKIGRIVAAKATAKLTRKNAELVKVLLDNGEEIKCTPDHQFMLRNGEYREARDLITGTSLMPFYSKIDNDGHTSIQQNYSGKWQKSDLAIASSDLLEEIPSLHDRRQDCHCYNHKVVEVISLSERQDVYCLTVPEYGNFALKAGVFVHNCGMAALKMPFKAVQLEGKLKKIRKDIEAVVPIGFGENKEADKAVLNWQGWSDFKEIHRGVQNLEQKAVKQMSSLGTGNHFIEICLDTEDNVWLMLHSGSRGIGNQLAQCHISTAKELAKLAESKLPDPDLAHFVAGTPEFEAYWHDLQWAQDYARYNREMMMARVKKVVEKYLAGGRDIKPLMAVNCHHNYAEKEVHFGEEVYVTRKGAVRANQEDYGIIPGSMGTKSYIVKGKGNHDSYCSCFVGETLILTDRGLMAIADVYDSSLPIKLISYNSELQQFEAKDIIDRSVRNAEVDRYFVSQSGRDSDNTISCTSDHPFATYDRGKLTYQSADLIVSNSSSIIVPTQISLPSDLSIEELDFDLYYSIGKILPDLTISSLKNLINKYRTLTIEADIFLANLSQILLANPCLSLYFLAGYLEQFEKYDREILTIEIERVEIFSYLIPALLSLGIAYKVEDDRNNYSLSLTDNIPIEKLRAICQSIVMERSLQRYDSKQLVLASVATIGKEKDRESNSSAISNKTGVASKLDCASLSANKLFTFKDKYRALVYNFTVADNHNYIVFSDLYTPILVHNCSHGAGRSMSRTMAKNTYTLDDLIEQTKGIECRKDTGIIDEIPAAYKSIDEVMQKQTDLVEVVATLKQVLCIKG